MSRYVSVAEDVDRSFSAVILVAPFVVCCLASAPFVVCCGLEFD